ncbi:uncharacterized protein LOC113352586 [Papaver somniferum]|uniref:uncharacterized protein LOC113352586 n=1 Tax=Papaver somniferum TaxID=3469 RepID=UPI000E6FE645|nr:uncharacterized protein LOC113352586 [Papaver somniferum]
MALRSGDWSLSSMRLKNPCYNDDDDESNFENDVSSPTHATDVEYEPNLEVNEWTEDTATVNREEYAYYSNNEPWFADLFNNCEHDRALLVSELGKTRLHSDIFEPRNECNLNASDSLPRTLYVAQSDFLMHDIEVLDNDDSEVRFDVLFFECEHDLPVYDLGRVCDGTNDLTHENNLDVPTSLPMSLTGNLAPNQDLVCNKMLEGVPLPIPNKVHFELDLAHDEPPKLQILCLKVYPLKNPGFGYQVEIPPFILETEPFQLVKGLSEEGIMVDVADSFVEALPIPIMWINNVNDRRDDKNGSLNSKNTKHIIKSSNKEVIETTVKSEDKIYCAAPGCLCNSWTDLEKEAILLGLYIFGKNLVTVKRFVKSKAMADILSFYYGEFYRSAAYLRWSSSRNKDRRSRRCIQGPKMFKTWRQHKFLSCLLPLIPEKCHATLVEVSKNFEASNLSLEDYVSTLKATIGLAVLVEVFGIGKGKQDLTGLVTDPARNNQQVISHPEIPVGKGCSTLTLDEIVGFLTGDYLLSKSRSNDLFWEAVWPRLLARGWQSKQPKKHNFVSDPRLIELEDEPGKANIGSQENDCDNKKMKLEKGGSSDHKRSIYLQPQLPKSNSDLMKFTVVDTSMGDGEDPFLVRELRSLPVQTTETSFHESLSSHSENGFKELAHEKGVVDMSLNCTRDTSTCRRKNPSQPNCLSPVIKRRRLTACCEAKAICSKDSSSRTRGMREEEDPHLYLGSSDSSDNMVSEVTQSQEKVYSSSSGKGSPDENFFGKYISQKEKYPPRLSIDLNLPHVLSNVETDQPFFKEVEISQSDPSFEHPPSPASSELTGTEQQLPGLVSRRQGTRKRPLTAKALEALACGFLTTKRKPR